VPLPDFSLEAFLAAATALVLPQVPLTFANSCLAPADAARVYFGKEAARRVTPSRLATSLGVADLVAGAIGGMPVCHGAGGMTAHRSFGARTGGAPFIMGTALLVLAIGFGAGLAGVLAHFPVAVLAGLLAVAGLLHMALARDLTARRDWLVAVVVGVSGVAGQLALGLVVGLVLAWGLQRLDRPVAAPNRG
jgi:MFS superfamily sulfate permease-like transporter